MVKNNSVQTIEDTSSILPKIKSNYNSSFKHLETTPQTQNEFINLHTLSPYKRKKEVS